MPDISGSSLESLNVFYTHTPSFTALNTYFHVQNIGHQYWDNDFIAKRQGFRSILLCYTLSGRGILKYRDKLYELNKNNIFLINCNDYHEYSNMKDMLWEIKWIHFHGCSSEEYFNNIYDKSGPVINMPDNNYTSLYIDSLIKLITEKNIHFEIKASSFIVQMLTELLLTPPLYEYPNIKDGYYINEIASALVFIRENYNSNILVEDMAKTACISISHFSRVFKKVTGFAPHEYLVKYRINTAKNLLRESDHSIDEISGMVGFESMSNFIKTFKEHEDITPAKFKILFKTRATFP